MFSISILLFIIIILVFRVLGIFFFSEHLTKFNALHFTESNWKKSAE